MSSRGKLSSSPTKKSSSSSSSSTTLGTKRSSTTISTSPIKSSKKQLPPVPLSTSTTTSINNNGLDSTIPSTISKSRSNSPSKLSLSNKFTSSSNLIQHSISNSTSRNSINKSNSFTNLSDSSSNGRLGSSSSNNNIKSSSSISSSRKDIKGKNKKKTIKKESLDNNTSTSASSSSSSSSDSSESDSESNKLIPIRKSGFGSLSTNNNHSLNTNTNTNNTNYKKSTSTKTITNLSLLDQVKESNFESELDFDLLNTCTTTEDEAGFATAKENSFNSIIDLINDELPIEEEEEDTQLLKETEKLKREKEKEEEEENGKKENVVVCIRVRPTRFNSNLNSIYKFSPLEGKLQLESIHPIFLKRGGNSHTNSNGGGSRDEYDFKFDALHLSPKPTQDLYDTKIKPVVRAAMEGFNGTVFAYGQTASGKTHTMIGNQIEPGIIPLAISELFDFISEQDDKRTFTLRVSFLEIYNETFHDLLLPLSSTSSTTTTTTKPLSGNGNKKSKPLEVQGEDGLIKGLEERPVSDPEDVLGLLEEGELRRRTGETDWNERSSRSHCVFVVIIESLGKGDGGIARTSRLNLIDLAGSESATGQDERRKEGAFINKSLLTLGTVIGKLTESKGNGANQHIPYRDSKLTRLLQPALSGNSKVAIICTISPDLEQATETLSTLKFAKRAKMVVTKAERGVLLTEKMMLQVFAAQVATLQAQIASKESGIEEINLMKERDFAIAKANELQSRNRQAEDELISKELELNKLKELLTHTKSFILTGPVLEENAARRISGTFPSMLNSPIKGKRVVSEMSGLGFGTPRNGRMNTFSGSTVEKESSTLEVQLLEAQAKLSKLLLKDSEINSLKTELDLITSTSSTTTLEIDSLSKIILNLNLQIKELEFQIEGLKSELSLTLSSKDGVDQAKNVELEELKAQVKVLKVEASLVAQKDLELDSLRLELSTTKEGVEKNTKELIRQTSLVGINSKEGEEVLIKLASAIEELAKKEKILSDMEIKLKSVERKLIKGEGKNKIIEVRDATITTLEKELNFVKKELASLTVTKGSAIQAAQDLTNSMKSERDSTLKLLEESKVKITEMEENAVAVIKDYNTSEKSLRQEHQIEVEHLKLEIERLKGERKDWKNKASKLQRSADAREELEQQQAANSLAAKSGTDSLKSKLAELQLRSSSNNNNVPSNLSSSTRSSTSRTSNQISPKVDSIEALVELQLKNAELQLKLTELERQSFNLPKSHSTTFGPSGLSRTESNNDLIKAAAASLTSANDLKERERLNSIVESQKDLLEESHKIAENWREKYLASQKALQRLSDLPPALPRSRPLPLPTTRSYLREINVDAASLPRVSKGSSGSTNASLRPLSSSSTTTSCSSPQSHSYTGFVPPPLPYSPRNTEKERKLRRETITKDLARLNESRGIEKKIEALGSPNTTTSSLNSNLNRNGGNGSPSVKDRENFLHRRSKSSTDTGRYWS